jgi:argininosuccinate synthase
VNKSHVLILASTDTSCILAWLIEQGYEVYAFMADVGQEEVRTSFTFPVAFLIILCSGL